MKLTEAAFNDLNLGVVFPKEAVVFRELVVQCSVFQTIFEKNERGEWNRSGRPGHPFDRCRWPKCRFSMSLDLPGNPVDEEALRRSRLKGLVLGLFDVTIRIMLVMKVKNC